MYRIGAIADASLSYFGVKVIDSSVTHAQFVHQVGSYRILREGRAPILVTRPLWTNKVERAIGSLLVFEHAIGSLAIEHAIGSLAG